MEEDVYRPHYDIENSYLSKAIFRAWPEEEFNVIEGIAEAKEFYRKAYDELIIEAENILEQYHPAAWIRIAYMQLEAWSLIYWLDDEAKKKIKLDGPDEMAPAGRYGWRYVVEKSLEKSNFINRLYSSTRPTDYHINALFGIITSLIQVAEISNYLHYLPNHFNSVKIQFSPYIFNGLPQLSNEENEKINSIREYINSKNDYNTFPGFEPESNEEFKHLIDDFLEVTFDCNMAQIKKVQETIYEKVCQIVGGSILVDSYNHFASLCSLYTGYKVEKIKKILTLLLLNSEDNDYKSRDFLNKSQPKRMLNYCGVLFKLEDNFECVYDSNSSNYSSIRDSSFHVIIAPDMMIEWEANFYFRTALGQRTDLKSINKTCLRKLSDIEDYYHKKIFEVELKKIFEHIGFDCILNVKKAKNINLLCGEIDMLCYRRKDNSITIIEAKSSSPTYDARSMGKSISDHYKQKNYHSKFLKKISWVSNNLEIVAEIFALRGIKNITIPKFAGAYFITAFPSVMKFFCEEYTVLKYDEIIEHYNNLQV
jgi:hypothetical protein